MTYFRGITVKLWSINEKRPIVTTDFEEPYRIQYFFFLVGAVVWAFAWIFCCVYDNHRNRVSSAGFLLAVASAILSNCAATFDSSQQIWTQLSNGLIMALLVVTAISAFDSQVYRLQTNIIIVMICGLAWAVEIPYRFEVMAGYLASTVLLIPVLAISQRMLSVGEWRPPDCERNVGSKSSFSIMTILAIVTAVALTLPSMRECWLFTTSFSTAWTVALVVQIVIVGASTLAAVQARGTSRIMPIIILVISLVASWRIQDLLPFSWQDTDGSARFGATSTILTEPLIPLALMTCVVGGLGIFTNALQREICTPASAATCTANARQTLPNASVIEGETRNQEGGIAGPRT